MEKLGKLTMTKFLKTEKGWYMLMADGYYRRLEWTPQGVVFGEKLNA